MEEGKEDGKKDRWTDGGLGVEVYVVHRIICYRDVFLGFGPKVFEGRGWMDKVQFLDTGVGIFNFERTIKLHI